MTVTKTIQIKSESQLGRALEGSVAKFSKKSILV